MAKHLFQTDYTLQQLNKIKSNDEIVLVTKDGKTIKTIKVK
jgi:hypothetical protein